MESAAPVLTGTTVTSVRAARRRVRGADRPGHLARADGGARQRRQRRAPRCRSAGAAGAGRDHHAHARRTTATPASCPTAGCWWSAPRPAGSRSRRAAPLRAAGHPRRRRARPDAADLPRPGHPVVDGRLGPARRALRRGSRPAAGAQPAVDAAGRHAGAGHARPERAAHARGAAGRPAGRDPGRDRAVLRLAAQRVRAGRPEAGPAAGHHRRLGRPGRDRRRSAAAAVRADRGSRARSAGARPAVRARSASIVWATGYRPDLSWLHVPVLDRKGRVVHDGGVTAAPGPVPDRHAVPAPPQVQPHRRRRRGRRRADRTSRGLPRHARCGPPTTARRRPVVDRRAS